jgi:two-component sensor histidine kinase
MQSDLSYFRRRASEERTAALQARHPKARQAHLDMAERYENRVRDMTAHHEQLYVPLIEAS